MAVDKLVDSTQLDADLTSVANAIRTKGGTSGSLAFPAGFVSAVQAIPSGGGGYTLEQIAKRQEPSGEIDITGLGLLDYGLQHRTAITSVIGTAGSASYGFDSCSGITGINVHLTSASGNNMFASCTNMTTAVLSIDGTNNMVGIFNGCTRLAIADFLASRIRNNTFYNNSALKTIILRRTSVCALESTGALTGSPFASGKSGGTIYIPKSLYDHLGDGTSSDYKAATNWSTLDGYGTVTWAKIEGSEYEI